VKFRPSKLSVHHEQIPHAFGASGEIDHRTNVVSVTLSKYLEQHKVCVTITKKPRMLMFDLIFRSSYFQTDWYSLPYLKEARISRVEIGHVEVGRVGRVSDINTNFGEILCTVQRTFTGQQVDTRFAHGRAGVEGNASIQTTQGTGARRTASRKDIGEAKWF
jgi:hypothetical protein